MPPKRKPEGSNSKVYPIFAKKSKLDASESQELTLEEVDVIPDADAEARLTAFQELLDLSSLTKEDEIATRFDQIAKTLLHEFRIVVRPARESREVEFQVMEAEFYLQLQGIHEDPFTHGSEEQKLSGRWYFHRAPRFSKDSHRSSTSLTEYRDGSRKGMDLTFGGTRLSSPNSGASGTETETKRIRGGVLLRSIREVKGGKIISGPSLLVDRILEASKVSGIKELVEQKWSGDISAFPPTNSTSTSEGSASAARRATTMYLKPVKIPKSPPSVYFSPRIGLDLSHPGTTKCGVRPLHPRIQYVARRYRFFVEPNLLNTKGRPQTFLGVLESCISTSSQSGGLERSGLSNQVARLMGNKEGTAAKYLEDYVAGRSQGSRFLDSVIGPNGKGASNSVSTYLKMMGAISSLDA